MNTEAVNQEYQTVNLSQLIESLTNPRKTFDHKALNEMADSIRAVGLLQPILVRPTATEGRFEIVAGARRFRAARLAEIESVSVRVCQLTDAQALEAQVVENLIRGPVHGSRVGREDRQERYVCTPAPQVGRPHPGSRQELPERRNRHWPRPATGAAFRAATSGGVPPLLCRCLA